MRWYYNQRNGDAALSEYGDPSSKRRGGAGDGAPPPPLRASGASNRAGGASGSARPQPPAGRAHGKAAAAGGGGRGDAARLQEEIARLKVLNSAVEAERDFYFAKLRDIELCCEEHRPAFDNLEGTALRTFITKLLDVLGPQSPSAANDENEGGKRQRTAAEVARAPAGADGGAYVTKAAAENLPSPLFLFSP